MPHAYTDEFFFQRHIEKSDSVLQSLSNDIKNSAQKIICKYNLFSYCLTDRYFVNTCIHIEQSCLILQYLAHRLNSS